MKPWEQYAPRVKIGREEVEPTRPMSTQNMIPIGSASDTVYSAIGAENLPSTPDPLKTVTDLAKTVDYYTGAPARSGMGAYEQSRERGDLFPELQGVKGFFGSFGRHPDESPTGFQVARYAGINDQSWQDRVNPSAYSSKYSEMIPDISTADVVGLGIEGLVEVPTGLGMFMGAGAKGFSKGRKFSGMWDKKPRFEISDAKANIKDDWLFRDDYEGTFSLPEVLDHPELFREYPELKNLKVYVEEGTGSAGSYLSGGAISLDLDNIGKRINISNDAEGEVRKTLLHEIQHYVQDREGFAKGGSPQQFNRLSPEEYSEQFDRLMNARKIKHTMKANDASQTEAVRIIREDWQEEIIKGAESYAENMTLDGIEKELRLLKNSPDANYRRLAGEAESRSTEARMKMTMAERMRTQPLESTGLGLSDLIVRGESGPMSSILKKAPLTTQAKVAKEMKGIKAFHGSPHEFDKFLMEQIGTGEGAQAFGHGLYFTSKEDIARHYAETLGDGGRLEGITPGRYGGDMDTAEKIAKDFFDQGSTIGDAKKFKTGSPKNLAEKVINDIAEGKVRKPKNLYDVTLREGDYLKWDEPVSAAQVGKIEDALGGKIETSWNGLVGRITMPGTQADNAVIITEQGITGKNLYMAFKGKYGGAKSASEKLKKMGLEGIDYPAGSISRITSNPKSRNYVVFDEDAVKINNIRKLLLPFAATAGAGATMGPWNNYKSRSK